MGWVSFNLFIYLFIIPGNFYFKDKRENGGGEKERINLVDEVRFLTFILRLIKNCLA